MWGGARRFVVRTVTYPPGVVRAMSSCKQPVNGS